MAGEKAVPRRRPRRRRRLAAKKSPQKPVRPKPKKPAAKACRATACRGRRPKPFGQAGRALDGVQDPRLHPCAIGADLHAAARLYGRRRDQGRTARRRRHHAQPVARRERRRQPLFHHAQRHQALDHDRFQASQGQGNPRSAGEALRRAGRELRARRARPHGADLGAHPQAQPAHDRRLGEGLRPGPLRGLQGLRERRAMRRRRRLDHRLPRRAAARHRRADRRFRHRAASRARHRLRALSAHPHRPRPESARAPCRTACSTSRASNCATSSASSTGRSTEYSQYGEGVPFGDGDAARRQRFRRRPARLDPQMQGLGERSRRLHLFHHPGAGLGARSAI